MKVYRTNIKDKQIAHKVFFVFVSELYLKKKKKVLEI